MTNDAPRACACYVSWFLWPSCLPGFGAISGPASTCLSAMPKRDSWLPRAAARLCRDITSMEPDVGNSLRLCILLGGAAAMLASGYAAGHFVASGHGRATVSALKLAWEEERREAAAHYVAALAGAPGR